MDDLQVYEMQLHQVEAALITDPNNHELLKLKYDLEELIKLACEVLQPVKLEKKSADRRESDSNSVSILAGQWKVGYQCMAPWSEDGKYYKATIDSIGEDGTVRVTFDEYQNKDTAKLSQLRDMAEDWEAVGKSKKRKASNDMDSDQQREYKKKRKQKKLQHFQKIEEEKEQEKNNWLKFANKLGKKGLTKKSIFATPDGTNGRVGVGTCGISGKEMTKFSNAENKWKRGF